MELISKSVMVMLAVLIISSISCTRVIPVKLELPKKPTYYHDISKDVIAIHNRVGKIMYYQASIEAVQKLAKNKIMCREYNDTLQAIIKTTH